MTDGELNSLTFAKVLETGVLERRAVEEELFSLAFDEAEALVREFLDRALGHVGPPSGERKRSRPGGAEPKTLAGGEEPECSTPENAD